MRVMTKPDGTVLPYSCQSVDWWFLNGKCHLSYGTSCDPSPGSMASGTETNYYEKYCVCKLSTTALSSRVYDYDPSLTHTTIYDYTDWITETNQASCGILQCVLFESDCSTALPAPFSSIITVGSSTPWAVTISQTENQGYPDYTFCY